MPSTIITLIGHPASGKTTAAKYLQDNFGFEVYTFSKVIRDYAAANGIELKRRADYAATHRRMLQENGWDYSLKLALASNADRLCIDDVRSPRFAEVLQQAGSIDIAFDCPVELRYAHVKTAHDTTKYPRTLKAFIKSEYDDNAVIIGAGLAFDTDRVMAGAAYHIDASGSVESTLRQLDAVLEAVL